MRLSINKSMFIVLLNLLYAVTTNSLIDLQTSIPCNNIITGERGICVFGVFHCYVTNGIHIATCINGHLIGSCCKLKMLIGDLLELPNASSSISTEWLFGPKNQTLNPLFDKDLVTTGEFSQVKKASNVSKSNFNMAISTPTSINIKEVIFNSIPYYRSYNKEKQRNIFAYNAWQTESLNMRYPVQVDVSHNQRQPVVLEESHDMRKPVIQEKIHNLRKPVALEYAHNMHVPVVSYALQNVLDMVSKRRHGKILPSHSTNCGISRTNSVARIVGGFQSSYLKWPWMISLRELEENIYKHKCGAVLLNQLWAISVAHCVHRKHPHNLVLRLGEYNLWDTDELHQHIDMRVYLIIRHPEFNYHTYENDIVLFRFYYSVPFHKNIAPICLPQISDDIQGQTAVVTGWGKLAEGGELPGYLHEVHLPILSNKDCEQMYAEVGYFETIPDTFICAGMYNGGYDACEGDSGGPMIIEEKERQWSLIGLVSWGIGCAAPKQPGLYTRITKYVEWIKSVIAL